MKSFSQPVHPYTSIANRKDRYFTEQVISLPEFQFLKVRVGEGVGEGPLKRPAARKRRLL
jgi:hypothetical protein